HTPSLHSFPTRRSSDLHERIVVEVVLRRPQAVETQIGGEPSQPDLLIPHTSVGAVLPAVAGEHHHHADIHGPLLPTLVSRRNAADRKSTRLNSSHVAIS